MRRVHQTKIVTIIALVIAVGVMTIGFAAFSASLTISSSATVTPDESEFLLKMYGFTGQTIGWDFYDMTKYTSEVSSSVFSNSSSEFISDTAASINNNLFSLNVSNINFTEPGEEYITVVKIVNEGNYDAYLDFSQFQNINPYASCVAEQGTSQNLVDSACSYILTNGIFYNEESFSFLGEYILGDMNNDEWDSVLEDDCFYNYDGVCKLEVGKSVFLGFLIEYKDADDAYVDGPFSVDFSDIEIKFTSSNAGIVTE